MSTSPFARKPEPRPAAPPFRVDPGPDAAAAAFGLASFLHPNREIALRVAIAALSKLEVAVSAQDKRLYYRGRDSGASFKAGAFRRKVWMVEKQLLQRLVAIESEPFEREGEKPGASPLAPEDGVVRFVKHLFRITSRRNAFYVALGVGRVLHGYNTVETKAMYDALAPESAAEKAEDYFRARKAVLMREIRERFGDALTAVRGAHGEERFETIDSQPFAALVSECLEWFTPWGTMCPAGLPLPERPASDAHESEMERMHTMLHPACFGRLARWLGLDDPASRLQIPRLSFAREGAGSGPRRGDTPPLTPGEKQTIDDEIRSQSARRRRSAARLLRCDVDGVTAGYLDPDTGGRLIFDVGEVAERIEVFSRTSEGDVPLASCLLTRDERTDLLRPGTLSLVLEGGQRVSFAIDPSEGGGAHVEVSYREPFLSGVARVLSRGGRVPLAGFIPLRTLAAVGVAAAAVALVLSTRTAHPPASDDGGRPGPEATPAVASAPTAAPAVLAPPAASASSGERGVEPATAAVVLGTVRTIWVEAEGARGVDQLVRERLAGGVLRVAENRDMADALLRLRGSAGAAPGVRAELRGPDGTTLWAGPQPYTGTPEEISRKIVSELGRDAAAARTAPPRRPPGG